MDPDFPDQIMSFSGCVMDYYEWVAKNEWESFLWTGMVSS